MTTPKPKMEIAGAGSQSYGAEDDFKTFREIGISQFSIARKNRIIFFVMLYSISWVIYKLYGNILKALRRAATKTPD